MPPIVGDDGQRAGLDRLPKQGRQFQNRPGSDSHRIGRTNQRRASGCPAVHMEVACQTSDQLFHRGEDDLLRALPGRRTEQHRHLMGGLKLVVTKNSADLNGLINHALGAGAV